MAATTVKKMQDGSYLVSDDMGRTLPLRDTEDAVALVDQFAELDVLPTKAAGAIQAMNAKLQALSASELMFLRSLVTNLIMKENKQ